MVQGEHSAWIRQLAQQIVARADMMKTRSSIKASQCSLQELIGNALLTGQESGLISRINGGKEALQKALRDLGH